MPILKSNRDFISTLHPDSLVSHSIRTIPCARSRVEEGARFFRSTTSNEPGEIVAAAHSTLRNARGATIAIARLDPRSGEIRYCGVGNIAGGIVDPATGRSTHLIRHNGTVGNAVRKTQAPDHPWPDSAPVMPWEPASRWISQGPIRETV